MNTPNEKQLSTYLNTTGEIGFVEQITHPLIQVSGLPGAKPGEVILFENGSMGQVTLLEKDLMEVLVFSTTPLLVGMKAARTNETLSLPISNALIGHVVNALGEIQDGSLPHGKSEKRPFNQKPPGIAKRKRITKPLTTGTTIVDLIIPLGCGQRQLVIGDRKVGKSSFLLQTMLTQARAKTLCIYAAIGKKKHDIKQAYEFFKTHGVLDHIIIVAQSCDDPIGMIYLTPQTAMTLAEYFKDQGQDTLVILDDLSTHAKFYRELSLLGKRFPGRNSYPADIFHQHAKLLERAGNFRLGEKNVSITALPVVETLQGDMTGYIQTNIMSMTDGHIFFDQDMFAKGRRPAINPFLSVTRVGRQTQSNVARDISRELTTFLSLYEKMQNFSHFGAELSDNIKTIQKKGDAVLSFLNQPYTLSMTASMQILIFSLLWQGIWDNVSVDEKNTHIQKLLTAYEQDGSFAKEIDTMIASATSLNDFLTKTQTNAHSIQGV